MSASGFPNSLHSIPFFNPDASLCDEGVEEEQDTVLGTHEGFVKATCHIVRTRLEKVAKLIQTGSGEVNESLNEIVKIIKAFQKRDADSDYSRLCLAAIYCYKQQTALLEECVQGILQRREENLSDFEVLTELLREGSDSLNTVFFRPLLDAVKIYMSKKANGLSLENLSKKV